MDSDRDASPAPTGCPDTPGRSSRVSSESSSRKSSRDTARGSDTAPGSTLSGAGNGSDHQKPLREPPATAYRGPALRYRRTPFWLTLLYLPTLILPWVLLCVMDQRPLMSPSYHNQKTGVSTEDYGRLSDVLAFVNVVRAISGVIVVPITSIILAHSAVVYSQRRRHGQELNARQLFALADRGWADIGTLWTSGKTGSSSRLLWLGALLLLLGGIQQPLQSLLVTVQPTVGLACTDIPVRHCGFASSATTVAYDAEPWAIALAKHTPVVEEVSNGILTVSDQVIQDYLWVENPHFQDKYFSQYDFEVPAHRSMLNYYMRDYGGKQINRGASFFVTSLVNGTDTGLLREHALRLNSSVTCENIPRSEYPSTCPGERPLVTEIETGKIELRVCAPGEVGRHPWSRTRNREDIEEELYIDFQMGRDVTVTSQPDNFTTHCTAGTTRGYFELGNAMNDNVYGPLLEKWPSNETIENDTNDFVDDNKRPGDTDYTQKEDGTTTSTSMGDPFGAGDIPVSGPLLTSATALFGNNSFLHLLSDNATAMSPGQTLTVLCEHTGFPFTQVLDGAVKTNHQDIASCNGISEQIPLDGFEEYAGRTLGKVVASWFKLFEETWDTENLLEIAMFLANKATLNRAAMRQIYYSPGTQFSKPTMSRAAMIVVSVFILLQAVGMAALVWYVNTAPSWTPGLDAMAMARIGRAMRPGELPPIGPVSEEDRQKLREVDALVGVVDDGEREGPGSRDAAEVSWGQPGPDLPLMDLYGAGARGEGGLRLGLGAKGLIAGAFYEKPSWFGLRRRKEGRDEKV